MCGIRSDRYLAAVFLSLLAACAPIGEPPKPPPAVAADGELTLSATSFVRLPGWTSDAHGGALAAFGRSCARRQGFPAGRPPGGSIGRRPADWRPICAAMTRVPEGDHGAARAFFEAWFIPYLAAGGGDPRGLFTGYYEAELKGAWSRHGPYGTPIYAPPADLVAVDLGRFRNQWKGQHISGRVAGGRLVPQPSRAEIDGGALSGQGLELLWVDDPVDAFFLHIQGSGRVVMEDGRVVRLGFAGRNGHPYKSIGRVLIARGAIENDRVTMQSIRAWLRAHPADSAALMARNPSYIFFSIGEGEGPIGAEGSALTPGRSLAVDTRFVPFGVPVWLDTTDPLEPSKPLRRLVVAQDTGSAIKGAVRGDLFWGFGDAAGARAGAMKQTGSYYLLLPKSIGSQ